MDKCLLNTTFFHKRLKSIKPNQNTVNNSKAVTIQYVVYLWLNVMIGLNHIWKPANSMTTRSDKFMEFRLFFKSGTKNCLKDEKSVYKG